MLIKLNPLVLNHFAVLTIKLNHFMKSNDVKFVIIKCMYVNILLKKIIDQRKNDAMVKTLSRVKIAQRVYY